MYIFGLEHLSVRITQFFHLETVFSEIPYLRLKSKLVELLLLISERNRTFSNELE